MILPSPKVLRTALMVGTPMSLNSCVAASFTHHGHTVGGATMKLGCLPSVGWQMEG